MHRLGERDLPRRRVFRGWQASATGRAPPLPDLLAAALKRAFALEAMNDVVAVAQHLHLDMPRALDQLLDIKPAIAKRCERLGLRLRHQCVKLFRRVRDADATPATAGPPP